MSVISLLLDGGRDSKIRGKTDENGLENWSVYNFVSTSCEKDNENARSIFNKLLHHSEYKNELKQLTKYMILEGILKSCENTSDQLVRCVFTSFQILTF